MPTRADLNSVVVVGDDHGCCGAAGSDRSSAEVCRVLRAEGIRVVAISSNPATVLTDPGLADAAYVEPVTPDHLLAVLTRERPDALLPVRGSGPAMEAVMDLVKSGVLKAHGVDLLGVGATEFDSANAAGTCRSEPSTAPDWPPRSTAGWREYELVVLRDDAGSVLVADLVENIDRTAGGSAAAFSVSPAMTPEPRDRAMLSDTARAMVANGTGSAGAYRVRLLQDPRGGEILPTRLDRWPPCFFELRARPIAGAVTRLVLGHRLDEIALGPPASDDHVAVRMRWPGGHVVGLAGSFPEALQKALRSAEDGALSWSVPPRGPRRLLRLARKSGPGQWNRMLQALRAGTSTGAVARAAGIDVWFAGQLAALNRIADDLAVRPDLDPALLRSAKRHGFSDEQIGDIRGTSGKAVRVLRDGLGIRPGQRLLGTGPDLVSYSTYAEAATPNRPLTTLVVGSPGGNFTHSCVQAYRALRGAGHEVAVLHSDPASLPAWVRTWVAPCTAEDVHDVVAIHDSRPEVVTQFRGPGGRLEPPAHEYSVEALFDGTDLHVGGVIEHIDRSACVHPPIHLGSADVRQLRAATESVARARNARGPLQVRFTWDNGPHVVSVASLASAALPFLTKATGVPLAGAAARVIAGSSISELRKQGVLPSGGRDCCVAVRETGTSHEVMGISDAFGAAFAKTQAAVHRPLPTTGRVYLAAVGGDKRTMLFPLRTLQDLCFEIFAPEELAGLLRRSAIDVTAVGERDQPTTTELFRDSGVDLVVDIPRSGATPPEGSLHIESWERLTAATLGIQSLHQHAPDVRTVEEIRRGREL
ncbi:hypothetical protein [Saccharopolyspora taberi]|uniref:Carbamoyl-phosphate synthetase large subunit oligomerisation domain-containing protein n=1 Tax=Saccharopolyspora taberi TaxID=60895 RepID=A0ABN3VGB8_9PSEU